MSEQELIDYEKLLNDSLEKSFEKMLKRKMLLGQDVVTNDINGNPIVISAEQAWEYSYGEKPVKGD